MNVMVLVPSYYTYQGTFEEGFHLNGWKASFLDWEGSMPRLFYRAYKKTGALPGKLHLFRDNSMLDWVNKLYLAKFLEIKPDLVFIYNHQRILPDTLKKFRSMGARIAFILGDNPLYIRAYDYALQILAYSDYTIVPDSGWITDLKRIGLSNLHLDFMTNSKNTFRMLDDIPEHIRHKYQSDVLFIGRAYANSAGYKRALFLSSFSQQETKVFGLGNWKKWLVFFPELSNCFRQLDKSIGSTEYNQALNCCKVYPIDINPGIQNGIHMRVFEAISSGAYPLVEWTKDAEDVFGDRLLFIKDFKDASRLCAKLLQNDSLRMKQLIELQQVIALYSPQRAILRMLNQVS